MPFNRLETEHWLPGYNRSRYDAQRGNDMASAFYLNYHTKPPTATINIDECAYPTPSYMPSGTEHRVAALLRMAIVAFDEPSRFCPVDPGPFKEVGRCLE